MNSLPPRLTHLELPPDWQEASSRSCHEWTLLCTRIRGVLADRRYGMVLLTWPQGIVPEEVRLTEFALALASTIGEILPETRNTDGRELTATPAVEILLNGDGVRSRQLRHFANPEWEWPLHTDRVLHRNVGDFLMVGKLVESGGTGGEIRLLHLDDWPNFARFLHDRLARVPAVWKGDPQLAPAWLQDELRREPGLLAPVFDQHDLFGTTIRFTDARFRTPSSLDHARYLSAIALDLRQHAQRIPCFQMPLGSVYLINNRFVLHGRRGFHASSTFRRKLLRVCGDLH